MVKFGFQLNMSLVERDRLYCFLRNAEGKVEEYDVLASFPFTSESKKMGILLKSRATQKVLYYLKGAEVVMEPKIKAQARPALQESCENLALDGLRTLVFAQKLITNEECEKFMQRLKRAQQRLRNRETHVLKV
jgi:phospholipid-translocating ATPase